MATEKVTGRDSDKIMLRVPDGMRDRIAEAAKANGRSMNAEIVARLEASFNQGSGEPDALQRMVKELETLQEIASLNYKLQGATFKADATKTLFSQAWIELQKAISEKDEEKQKTTKAVCQELQATLDQYAHAISSIEHRISEIHFERKVTGLKELRDVELIYASVRATWTDTGAVTHDASSKKKR